MEICFEEEIVWVNMGRTFSCKNAGPPFENVQFFLNSTVNMTRFKSQDRERFKSRARAVDHKALRQAQRELTPRQPRRRTVS